MSFALNNGLNFGFADVYPNLGYSTTRTITIPEPDDQNTLVDDQEKAEQTATAQSPANNKGIFFGVGVFIILIILFGWR